MSLKDIFNSIGQSVSTTINAPLSKLFAEHYVAPPAVKKKMIAPESIGEHIMNLESNMGTHPNTAPDELRSFIIPAANGNEKPRKIQYRVGFGGYSGITPIGLGEFHKSQIDRNAPMASSTPYGLPLIPGRDVNRSLEMLKTLEGTKKLTEEMFKAKKKDLNDWTPETLTNDYMDNWVGKGTPSDTPANRARVLKYFQSLLTNQ